jgi:NADH-quinone oxidoreductase subunit H
MPEGAGPLWSLGGLVAAMAVLAWSAACLDGAILARAAGRRVTPAIMLAPVREAARLCFVQRSATTLPDSLAWRLGVVMVLFVPIVASTVIPLAPSLVVTDLLVGAIFWYGIHTLLWVGVHLVGWSANSHYPLVGAHRYLAQAFAYTMVLSIIVLVVATPAGTFRVLGIVERQSGLWFAVWAPAAFTLYLVTVPALAFWTPFATPVASDLAGGVAVELSGVDRLVFFAGRSMSLVTGAAFAVPLFLGGHHGPFLPGAAWIAVKTLAVLALLVCAGRAWPRVPVDRFEEVAWIVLIPLVLVQLFVVGGIALLVR